MPGSMACCIGRPPAAWSSSSSAPGRRSICPGRSSERAGDDSRCILAARAVRRGRDAFQDLTGYDRVMVYRFDDEGHGEVFSERRRPELEAYPGQSLPRVRHPADGAPALRAQREYACWSMSTTNPVPLRPRLSPITGQDLDMSLCFLRSMSPIHLQYLKNMGVGATLVVSLDGRRQAVGPRSPATTTTRASSISNYGRSASCWRRRSRPASRRSRALPRPRPSSLCGGSSSA